MLLSFSFGTLGAVNMGFTTTRLGSCLWALLAGLCCLAHHRQQSRSRHRLSFSPLRTRSRILLVCAKCVHRWGSTLRAGAEHDCCDPNYALCEEGTTCAELDGNICNPAGNKYLMAPSLPFGLLWLTLPALCHPSRQQRGAVFSLLQDANECLHPGLVLLI